MRSDHWAPYGWLLSRVRCVTSPAFLFTSPFIYLTVNEINTWIFVKRLRRVRYHAAQNALCSNRVQRPALEKSQVRLFVTEITLSGIFLQEKWLGSLRWQAVWQRNICAQPFLRREARGRPAQTGIKAGSNRKGLCGAWSRRNDFIQISFCFFNESFLWIVLRLT